MDLEHLEVELATLAVDLSTVTSDFGSVAMDLEFVAVVFAICPGLSQGRHLQALAALDVAVAMLAAGLQPLRCRGAEIKSPPRREPRGGSLADSSGIRWARHVGNPLRTNESGEAADGTRGSGRGRERHRGGGGGGTNNNKTPKEPGDPTWKKGRLGARRGLCTGGGG